MTGKSIKVIRTIELFFVTIVIGLVYFWHIDQVPFFEDESQWIATSFYFDALVGKENVLPEWTDLDPSFASSDTIWVENYWTLTIPPIPGYFIAIGRLIGGYQIKELNYPWQFHLDMEKNVELGAMPLTGLLWWSRLPMCLLATASGVLLFLLLRNGVNRFSAYTLLVLYTNNPFLTLHLRRAMGEAALLFFSVLAMYFAQKVLISSQTMQSGDHKQNRSVWGWLIGMSAAVGLAGASKVNGLVITIGVVGVILGIGFHFSRFSTRKKVNTFIIRAIALSLFIIAFFFVIVNPFLYPNPIYRTILMVKFRGYLLSVQETLYPQSVISNLTRPYYLFKILFKDFTLFSWDMTWIITCFLFIIGICYLLASGYKWLKNGNTGDASLVILLVMLTASIPSLFSPLDWSRYFLFPVIFICLSSAVGLGTTLSWLQNKILRRKQHDRKIFP